MRSKRTSAVALIWACALACAAGCGPTTERPETVPVKGTVSFKGKPLSSGTISFVSGDGHTATGPIGPDGSYTLSTFSEGDGVIPGTHRVIVVANDQPIDVMPGSSPGYKPTKDLIPKKYATPETSGLEATVAKGQTPIDFDLK